MSTQQLAQLIDAKFEVLRQLQTVARRQLQVIGEEDLGTLLAVLSAKQRVLEVLGKLDAQLAPYREDDPEQRRWNSAGDRERCRLQAERCELLLRELLCLEKQAEAAMLTRRGAVAGQLRNLEQSAEAGRAYAQAPGIAPTAIASSFDLTSEG